MSDRSSKFVEATIIVDESGRLVAYDLPDEVLEELEALLGLLGESILFGPQGLCG